MYLLFFDVTPPEHVQKWSRLHFRYDRTYIKSLERKAEKEMTLLVEKISGVLEGKKELRVELVSIGSKPQER